MMLLQANAKDPAGNNLMNYGDAGNRGQYTLFAF